jgi:hypothetical protein
LAHAFEAELHMEMVAAVGSRKRYVDPAVMQAGTGERRRFIAQYVWRIFLLWGAMMVAALLFFFFFFGRIVRSATVPPSTLILSDPLFYGGLGIIVLPASALMYWLGGAPARTFRGRDSLGPEPTKNEVRAVSFRKMSYQRLAFVALVGGASYAYIARGEWDRRWMVIPPLIVLFAAVQAFRKWRFERLHSDTL